jgi:hypothetical protein
VATAGSLIDLLSTDTAPHAYLGIGMRARDHPLVRISGERSLQLDRPLLVFAGELERAADQSLLGRKDRLPVAFHTYDRPAAFRSFVEAPIQSSEAGCAVIRVFALRVGVVD